MREQKSVIKWRLYVRVHGLRITFIEESCVVLLHYGVL